MKVTFFILFFSSALFASAQSEETKLISAMKEFHQALVNKNKEALKRQTDKALSYGHSNGWVETQTDMIADLDTGLIAYHSIKEDSLKISMNGGVANVRFIADINATMRGANTTFHLKVLEVWVKKNKQWVLFARQAIR
jgi:hypothetical protein